MTPPLSKKAGILNFLDKPIDAGKTFLGKPLLGSHKTWRGLVMGILVGFLVVLLQSYFFNYHFFQKISLVNYQKINIFLFGFLISAGAVFGDLTFAFLKRRLNLVPGAKFLPFDQINYVIGAAIFLTPFFKINISVWLTLLIATFFLHIIVNRLGYALNLHQAKW